MKKMISIIIPVYNVEEYLNRCIDSIIAQSYKQYEIILVDDGSTDRTREICDGYILDNRFKIIHQANLGVSVARNKGLSMAIGDYVIFIDADDWLAPEMLMKLVRGIGNADLAMCFHYVAREKEDGEYEFIDYWSHDKKMPYIAKNIYFDIFNRSATLWNKLIRRSVISGHIFNEKMTYGEDTVFLAECLENVKMAVIIPECLYYYFRSRKGNVVSAPIDRRSLELLDNTKVVFDYCKRNKHSSVGIRRIVAIVGEVYSKIPLTFKEVRGKKIYIKSCNSLLKYPQFADYVCFLVEKRISFADKRTVLLYRHGSVYMYYKVIKQSTNQLKEYIFDFYKKKKT